MVFGLICISVRMSTCRRVCDSLAVEYAGLFPANSLGHDLGDLLYHF